MMEVYGRLHEAYKKVVSITKTGKRYLGTYFRVAFFGHVSHFDGRLRASFTLLYIICFQHFGEDNEIQFIYKEPKVTNLTELTHRLKRLYTRKFGQDSVEIIMDSTKVIFHMYMCNLWMFIALDAMQVSSSSLNPTKAFIQVTHVTPYFPPTEILKRVTKFEQEINLSLFVFETPFTVAGHAHGDLASQYMRKTILTSKSKLFIRV